MAVAEVPGVVAGQTRERVTAMADGALDAVIAGLTQPWEQPQEKSTESKGSDALAVEAEDELALVDQVNRRFLELGWSDGFPVVPPTRRAVEQMLKGTKRPPREVIGVVEPGNGAATVEKIAINAVMAGCRPEHLPVVIAAVRAVTHPTFFLRDMQVSTSPEAPLLLVNGPIVKKIGLNSGTCSMGPGAISYVNTVVGRALRLVLMNVGECYPGQSDINTMGLPTKYGICVAENEAASPWGPFHVELGYSRDTSTVTVAAVVAADSIQDIRGRKPEPILDRVVRDLQYGGSLLAYTAFRGAKIRPSDGKTVPTQHVLLLSPDHARIIADAGWTKQDIKRYVFEHARLPQRLLDEWGLPLTDLPSWGGAKKTTGPAPGDELAPILVSPDSLIVAVVGGTGNISQFFSGCYSSVTVPVDE